MFPLRDDNPTLGTSIATFAIIGLNAAAWLLVQRLGSEPALTQSICTLGVIPGDLLGIAAPGTRMCVLGGTPSWTTITTACSPTRWR